MSSLIQPGPMGLVRRQFLKASESFDQHAMVFETIGNRLLERLDLLAIAPDRVLDLGCRSGYQLQALSQRYPKAHVVGADPAPGVPVSMPRSWPGWLRRKPTMAQRIACDPHALPFADQSFDLVVSNLMLPWCEAPHRVFEEAARVLTTGGAFMFTSAGPDTLIEYRAVWAKIDSYLHSFGLIDMHDLGDSLMAAGFAAPVLDRENLSIDYPGIEALQAELQRLGSANIATGRRQGLMSPQVRQLLVDSAETDNPAARFAVTLELVNGHGWKGALHPGGNNSGDDFKISVDTLRGSWKNLSRS